MRNLFVVITFCLSLFIPILLNADRIKSWGPRVGAFVERTLSPSYGTCFKCNRPWRFVEYHITDYTPSHGMFSLCEKCWQSLSPRGRLPYYKMLWERWGYDVYLGATWEDVKMAVLGE